ncbi:unnamed protein product [Phytophthora lilii]|uniref:Unnamed protein product n=1 Tax=Phytophthora lilii TaxID=2077276 RepID=A0A9W6WUI2_9STRA|nr:unnamed protein product [Phytophthora lilii]
MDGSAGGQTPPPGGEQAALAVTQARQQRQAAQQQQQQQVVTAGGVDVTLRWGSKPAKYTEDGGFDVYSAQIQAFLGQHEYWEVVSGTTSADPGNPQWSEKTKRAYGSEIRLRRDLYAAKFEPGESMEKYLDRLTIMRCQLANMSAVISDEEMVNIVLQGVVDSHCNVVWLFNRNGVGGAAPDLATVINVLLGEDETDNDSSAKTSFKVSLETVTTRQCPSAWCCTMRMVVPAVASAHDWMLDSGAGAHVCVNGGSFVKLVKNPSCDSRLAGRHGHKRFSRLIRLEVQPERYLELPAVRYAPGGTVNLISQRLLESTGWKPSNSSIDNARRRC